MKNIIVLFSLSVFFLCAVSLGTGIFDAGSAYAQEDWKEEYASVCAKTQNAMTLSPEELKDFIARCDTLQEQIDGLEGTQAATEKKVYTKRLKMCRDLYDFALKYKENTE